MWDELKRNKSNVKNYLDSEEEFQRIMNAEIITQYPKIGKKGNVGVDGIIEFERHKNDGSTIKLKFMNSSSFDALISKGDTDVLNYFTLDGQGNAVVATTMEKIETLSCNDEEADISKYVEEITDGDKTSDGNYSRDNLMITKASPINYKAVTEKYGLPFDYLWALLVVTEKKDFVMDLVKLVEDSTIVIGIYDNMTTTETTDITTYKRQVRTDSIISVKAENDYGVSSYPKTRYYVTSDNPNSDGDPTEEVMDKDYVITHVTTIKQNMVQVELSVADVWIMDYKRGAVYNEPSTSEGESNSRSLDDTEYKQLTDGYKTSRSDSSLLNYSRAVELAEEAKKYIESNRKTESDSDSSKVVDQNRDQNSSKGSKKNSNSGPVKVNVTSVQLNEYYKNVQGKTTTTTKITTQNYTLETPVSELKDKKDKKDENGNLQINFVSLLNSKKYRQSRNNLKSIAKWLFEIVENNNPNMLDLTKYLVYKATGKSFGVTEYDVSELYSHGSFASAGFNIYGDSLKDKVWFALKDLGYSDISCAGAMGNIDYESAGFTTTAVEGNGEGIGLCQWSFGRKKSYLAYASSKGVPWQDEDTQIEFLITEISGSGPAAGFAEHIVKGSILHEGIVATHADWASSGTVEDSTLSFMRFFEGPASRDSYGERLNRARGYLTAYQGKTAPSAIETKLSGENKEKMQKLINDAVRIANDNRYLYSQSFRDAEFYYDCSSFVGRLYEQFFGIPRLDRQGNGRGTDNIKSICTSRYKSVGLNDLQPGDILWKDGHVALYIGNNQIAEAQGTAAGIVTGNYKPGRFTEAYRVIY